MLITYRRFAHLHMETVICCYFHLSRSGGGTGGSCPAQDSWKFDATKTKWSMLNQCSSPRIYPAMAMLPSTDKKVRRAVLYGGDETGDSVLSVSYFAYGIA